MEKTVLVSVIIFLVAAIFVVTIKLSRTVKKAKKYKLTAKERLGKSVLERIKRLYRLLDKEDTKKVSKRFHKLMRRFFARYFNIDYEYTYVELNEEIRRKRGISKKIKDDITSFSIQLSEVEYSDHDIPKFQLEKMLKEASTLIRRMTGYREGVGEEEEEKPTPLFKRISAWIKRMRVLRKKEEPPVPKPPVGEEYVPPEERFEEKKVPVPRPSGEMVIPPRPYDMEAEKIRKLLDEAEFAIYINDMNKALELYPKIREIYDKVPPEGRVMMHPETVRIIKLYNEIYKRSSSFMDEIIKRVLR